MKITTINIPKCYLRMIEILVELGSVSNRSEAIRHAVKRQIKVDTSLVRNLKVLMKIYLDLDMGEEETGLKLATVNLPEADLEIIEGIVDNGVYPSRNEFVRSATQDYIILQIMTMASKMEKAQEKAQEKRELGGCARPLCRKLGGESGGLLG